MLQEKTKLELILRVCACAHPLIERLITEFTSTARTCTLPDNCSHTHTNAMATHTRLYARIIYRWIQLWLVCVQQYHDCWWLRGVSCIPALLWDANTGQHWAKVPSEGRPFPISARKTTKTEAFYTQGVCIRGAHRMDTAQKSNTPCLYLSFAPTTVCCSVNTSPPSPQ